MFNMFKALVDLFLQQATRWESLLTMSFKIVNIMQEPKAIEQKPVHLN